MKLVVAQFSAPKTRSGRVLNALRKADGTPPRRCRLEHLEKPTRLRQCLVGRARSLECRPSEIGPEVIGPRNHRKSERKPSAPETNACQFRKCKFQKWQCRKSNSDIIFNFCFNKSKYIFYIFIMLISGKNLKGGILN